MKRNERAIAAWAEWNPGFALPTGVVCRRGSRGQHEFVALYAPESDRRVVVDVTAAPTAPEVLKSLAKGLTV